jgi:hypothetical protein
MKWIILYNIVLKGHGKHWMKQKFSPIPDIGMPASTDFTTLVFMGDIKGQAAYWG